MTAEGPFLGPDLGCEKKTGSRCGNPPPSNAGFVADFKEGVNLQVATCMVCLSLVGWAGTWWSTGQRLACCQHLLKPTCRRSPDHQLDELPAKERIIATSRGSNQDKLVAPGEMANYGSCCWPELIQPPSNSLCRRDQMSLWVRPTL